MKKALIPLMIAILLTSLLMGCGDGDSGGKSITPIKLVPQKANLIAFVDLDTLLNDDDLAGLYDEVPKEPGDPQTLQEALDELGVNFKEGVVFGDLSEPPDMRVPESGDLSDLPTDTGYFGIIVKGTFEQTEFIEGLEKLGEEQLSTTDYNGYTVYTAPSEDVAIAFLGTDGIAIGQMQPVKDVIDVNEGASPISGKVLDTYNDLGSALLKLAMTVPPELLEEGLGAGGDEGAGMMGMDLSAIFDGIQTVGLTVDKQGDSMPIAISICFDNDESAGGLKSMLDGLLGMMGVGGMPEGSEAALDMLDSLNINQDGSCVKIDITLTTEMIEDMAGSLGDFSL